MIRIYAAAAAAIMLFAAGAWIGHTMTASSYEKDIIEAQIEKQAAVEAAAALANEQAEELEKARAQREIVYKTITKEVERVVNRPVYLNVCLDDDGLRLINDALAGPSTAPGQPDAAMPSADTLGRQDR